MIKDGNVIVSGCIQFACRKERRKHFYELKKEFGSGIRIKVDGNYITYKAEVNRNFI
jgi:hypothetical protein